MPRNEKIEALLTLGRVKRSIQNLLLLLDALEEEECYVNAYWVLALIIEVDPEKGRDYLVISISGIFRCLIHSRWPDRKGLATGRSHHPKTRTSFRIGHLTYYRNVGGIYISRALF